ncbi:MAG: diadenylate cyclase [Phycisphaeraceae bacterium]|nr:diadenylate cyclase [Phycisphaeraceae bacterium]
MLTVQSLDGAGYTRLRRMQDRIQQLFRGHDPLAVTVEMAVIFFGVYLMLRFIQGTRGAGVFKGLIVLVAGLFLALRFVGLFSDAFAQLRFLSEGLLGALALFLLVVFQPELRQGMVRLGQTTALGTDRRRDDQTVEAVAEAVEFLSRNSFGAVIAIERTVPLKGLAASGVVVDAAISARLLESIFWPSSPLHDLAVVIRGDRIAAASVQLPLAEETPGWRLGSRHRAALGATLETDALVIIVSEETGVIRMADNGRMSQEIRADDLLSALRQRLHAQLPAAPTSLVDRLRRLAGSPPRPPRGATSGVAESRVASSGDAAADSASAHADAVAPRG